MQDDIPRIAPIQYGRAEQEISDHKPVFAVLEMQVESTCTDQAALARRVVEVRHSVCVCVCVCVYLEGVGTDCDPGAR